MKDLGMRMKNPAHPGGFVREITEEFGLSVTDAAAVIEVKRPALSNLVNERASLSPEMALRIEKAFGVSMDTLMRMQNSYDIAQARSKEGEIRMSVLTDRQRIELALPACLLFTLSDLPGAFVPADPALVTRAEADIGELRENLRAASLEPFADLTPRKRQAVLRRLERIVKGVIAEWKGQSMLSLVLTLWHFLKDLTDRGILILWEGSAMDRAMQRLLPMFAHGFNEGKRDAEAAEQASRLLVRLQTEGLYH